MKAIHLLPLFFSASMLAQQPDSSSALFSMRDAEWNFARASVSYGRNAAFVKYFADESVIFGDKWLTNGKQFWQNLKASTVVLKWEPEFMDMADSRDFGISTGPWEAQEFRPNTAPLSTGYFLTVWKKQSDGEWKVIFDGGSTTPKISGPYHSFSFPAGADKVVTKPAVIKEESLIKELFESEKRVLTDWQNSLFASTYLNFLEPNARMQLIGHLPSTNADTISAWITKWDKSLLWKTSGAGAASSGDLGFTYGMLIKPGDTKHLKGHYVRIWKKRPGTIWKIAIEMINPD